ncbi:MAG: hypothetical protein ACI97A_002078 [Planctomycetota bacterium]|jgi:hypothetical protein
MPTTQDVPNRWAELENAFALPDEGSIWVFSASLALGGLLALYLRFLYSRSSLRLSGESIAKVFPLLTIVTIAVIFVVKTSLALSLGLVGALSIVRFRAAIKDPEELVYLFLCIGIGLSLGALQVWPAVALVVIASVFVLGFDRFQNKRCNGFLTIVGDATVNFDDSEKALKEVNKVFPHTTIERCEIDGEEGQLRLQLHRIDPNAAPKKLAQLRSALLDCQISFVNAESLP